MSDHDHELLNYVRVAVGREHALTEAQSRRLNGTTLDELHEDAKRMNLELGKQDPTLPARGADGQFTVRTDDDGSSMTRLLRQAAGR